MNIVPSCPPPDYTIEDERERQLDFNRRQERHRREVEAFIHTCISHQREQDLIHEEHMQRQARLQAQRQENTSTTRESVSATSQIRPATNTNLRASFLRGVVDETESTYKKNEQDACDKCMLYLGSIVIFVVLIFVVWIRKFKE